MGRTATGAGNMMQAAVDRIGGLVEDFNRQVFQPFLWKMYDLNRMFLPASVYRQILNDVLGDALQASFSDFMSGKKGIKTFSVLAGSHLAARQQMAQSMPLIMQYFSNPALAAQVADINGQYIDEGPARSAKPGRSEDGRSVSEQPTEVRSKIAVAVPTVDRTSSRRHHPTLARTSWNI
jgi:hypothetical protein